MNKLVGLWIVPGTAALELLKKFFAPFPAQSARNGMTPHHASSPENSFAVLGTLAQSAGMETRRADPFRRVKQSGLGREGSPHGFDEYTALKYLCVAI